MSDNRTRSPSEQEPIDLETLDTLRREISAEVLDILLLEFSGGLTARFGQLANSISDPAEVSAEAHVLKSEAATFGAVRLADACQDIEQAVRDGGTPSQLNVAIRTADDEARRYIKALETSTLLNLETI